MPRRRPPPVTDAPNGHFLSWLVAFMVYIAALALACLLILHDAAETWQRGLTGSITIQFAASGNENTDDEHVKAVMNVAATTPGVQRATVIPEDQVLDLLAPWLGSEAIVGDLPLPRLIDVTATADRNIDTKNLSKRLRAIVPNISVDDHGLWLGRLVRLIRAGELLSAVVVALIAAVTIGSVTVATRNGLAVHRDTVEVLHLLGAHDAFVAGEFAKHSFVQGLAGGILGLVFAVASVLGLSTLAVRLGESFVFDPTLSPRHWAILVVLPFVMAAIAMVTARFTVLRSLKRMM